MAKIPVEIKELISKLPKNELEKLVLKAASKDKIFHDYIIVNYLNKESGEKDLFDQAISDLNKLFGKGYKGFSAELRVANMLSACIKRINEFSKVCKNKNLEAELIVYVLEIPFSGSVKLGTCFTALDYKTSLLVKRLITLVTKKMHEDFLVEYKETINNYLKELHKHSNHINSIFAMPKEI